MNSVEIPPAILSFDPSVPDELAERALDEIFDLCARLSANIVQREQLIEDDLIHSQTRSAERMWQAAVDLWKNDPLCDVLRSRYESLLKDSRAYRQSITKLDCSIETDLRRLRLLFSLSQTPYPCFKYDESFPPMPLLTPDNCCRLARFTTRNAD